ncbi:MAG: D-alanyl-D-alanine carboxypeptidase/D-alanyl-D-alanine-endopeptidase [Candidatus Azobacteroides sp.]|nr:D-alanyl-D-alanine carboxypeptidase/D-alanyl-D-alanine-endopeptidase [Candidatus Azobacteroides sp.]
MRKFVLSGFCIFNLLIVSDLSAQQAAVDNFVQTKGLEAANLGVNVVDVKTGLSVAFYNKNKPLVPASVMKVLTTSTVLELYGPDYRIPTLLQYSGTIDSDGVLNGDVYVKGGGDPTLGSEYIDRDKNDFFDACISAIKNAGIRKITGRIVADETCFDLEGVSGKWLWEDLGNYFASGSYGISIYDNAYKLYLKSGKPGEQPQILRTDPNVDQIGFYNYLRAEAGNKDSAYIYGIPFAYERWLYGSVPAGRSEFVIKGDIPDPPYFLADCLNKFLMSAGISVSEPPVTGRLLDIKNERLVTDRTLLHTYYSPPLSDIIRHTNVKSDNHYAEHLFKLAALSKYTRASFGNGTDVILSYWRDREVYLSGVSLYDGSGLSPSDRLTPQTLTDVLSYMNNISRFADSFYASLPVAGVNGTVRAFLKGTKLEGKVHLKSGSINNVQCFAGYLDKNNKRYAFCIMANDYGIPRPTLKKAMEKLLLELD